MYRSKYALSFVAAAFAALVIVSCIKDVARTEPELSPGRPPVPPPTVSCDKSPEQKVEERNQAVAPRPAREAELSAIAPQVSAPAMRPMRHKRMAGGAATMGYVCMAAPAEGLRDNDFNTESYSAIEENGFRVVLDHPLSTFSIDVDAASYSNVRRFLNSNTLPPKDAVRIEELVNYFSYDYPDPAGDHPFSITAEVAECPWNEKHRLVHVGLQGRRIDMEQLPASNLVFLLDVSGSMQSPDKLPLVKSALKMLVRNLREDDRIAIAVYAGAAGLVLPATSGDNHGAIIEALDGLEAGGSTAGGAGINLAYKVARENFRQGGNNRVILCTDGDFNVGASSDAEMVRLIENKRDQGIFLTVLGFGAGNLKDSKMEQLADKGNGNYAYIDNQLEAKKVLVEQMGGTLHTIAKDVKIQVEFNPARVQAYRLIGYENRALRNEDFNDDKKDAGELGAGHSVTALYEIVPAGIDETLPSVDKLKYQSREVVGQASDELLTVKFRYKEPAGTKSKLIVHELDDRNGTSVSDDLRFSAAVAGFGMLLRNSEHKGDLTYARVRSMAERALGRDPGGYRRQFIRMVERAENLASEQRS